MIIPPFVGGDPDTKCRENPRPSGSIKKIGGKDLMDVFNFDGKHLLNGSYPGTNAPHA